MDPPGPTSRWPSSRARSGRCPPRRPELVVADESGSGWRFLSSRPILAAHGRTSMRFALLVAAISVLSAGGDWSAAPPAAARSTAEPVPARPEALVRGVSPEYKTRVTTLETTGKVQFNEEQLVRSTAPVTGRVVDVLALPAEAAESRR